MDTAMVKKLGTPLERSDIETLAALGYRGVAPVAWDKATWDHLTEKLIPLVEYVTTMRNGQPDRVPVRPLAAEITAKYAGFTCQEVTHDYRKAFEAVIRCCRDFEWDAAVPNMVYVWTGLTQAAGLRYYGVPGIDVGPDVAFQYREPDEKGAFMKREEYDELIADPTRFLYETWLPRVSGDVSAKGQPASYRNNLSFVKGAMATLAYFQAFGPQVQRMRTECGTVSAICGVLKPPLDVLADKLRGYLGLAFDLMEIPDKVLAACEAMMPHLGYLPLTGADPAKKVPIQARHSATYLSTSDCSGSLAAAADAAGAVRFTPVSKKSVPFCEKRKCFPLCLVKNWGSRTVK
jgi:hypothetical protein